MFGITERGDASRDLSWIQKMDKVVGAVLITKNIHSKPFQDATIAYKDKVIVHATITGMGGTFVEPNVLPWQEEMSALAEFVKEFPIEHVVLRIDPIIPTETSINNIILMLEEANKIGIKRVRFSFIDYYQHVKERGLKLPWDTFHAPNHNVFWAMFWLKCKQRYYGFTMESCGEHYPFIPKDWKVGCISKRDYDILKIKTLPPVLKSKQRKECLCINSKTELLSSRAQCPNKCLYCYWR